MDRGKEGNQESEVITEAEERKYFKRAGVANRGKVCQEKRLAHSSTGDGEAHGLVYLTLELGKE